MKKILLSVMFIFLASFVSADTVDFAFTDVQEKATLGAEAEFLGSIKNNDDVAHNFRFVVENGDWVVDASPRILAVSAGQSKNFKLELSPLNAKNPGTYGVTVSAIANEDEAIRTKMTFDVTYVSYSDFFDVSVEFPENFDPSTVNIARVTINNKEDFVLEDITVKLNSKYFTGEIGSIDLGPKASETFNVKLDFQTGYKQGIYNVDIITLNKNEEVYSKTVQAEIAYLPLDKEIKSPESGFLLEKVKVTKINEGDVVVEESYNKRLGYFEKLFTSYNVQPTSLNEISGGYVAEWDVELAPGEKQDIEITTDYRGFGVTLLVVIVAVILLAGFMRRDLTVSKNVVSLIRGKDGVSTFSVMLHAKNKSRSTLRNVRVMDTVYNIHPKDEINHSMLRPKLVKRAGTSARFIWELQKVEPGAEVNISYDVRTDERKAPTMFGSSALARYMSGTGKWKDVNSNRR